MPTEESAEVTEYEKVRDKLVAEYSYTIDDDEENKKVIEKIKLWDAVHGNSFWDKEFVECSHLYEENYEQNKS